MQEFLVTEQCLYKATGEAKLTKQELEGVILDTEIADVHR